MKKLLVTIAAIKGDMSYVWYTVKRKMLGIELRGKQTNFRPGDVIGLRASSDGRSTRMVRRDELNKIMTPTAEQVKYILSKVEPLIGGSVDPEKIGLIATPKVGVKERRINEELELMLPILKKSKDVTDLRVRDKRLYFKFQGRPYGVVSDPS